MHLNTKIATCCYCGTRAALTLEPGRHALTCGSCGAALQDLKSLPMTRTHAADARGAAPKPRSSVEAARPAKKAKRRKSGKKAKRFMKSLFDEIEDIFD